MCDSRHFLLLAESCNIVCWLSSSLIQNAFSHGIYCKGWSGCVYVQHTINPDCLCNSLMILRRSDNMEQKPSPNCFRPTKGKFLFQPMRSALIGLLLFEALKNYRRLPQTFLRCNLSVHETSDHDSCETYQPMNQKPHRAKEPETSKGCYTPKHNSKIYASSLSLSLLSGFCRVDER
jgi:hypothetical protein